MNSGQTGKVSHKTLQGLLSSDLDVQASLAGSSAALYGMLASSPSVRELRRALNSGEVLENEIREFTNVLLSSFCAGVLFEHDVVLAAIAVALCRWNTEFAEEFIIDLARLQNPEFRRSITVARIAAEHLYEKSETIYRNFRESVVAQPNDSWTMISPGREECADQIEEFTF